MASSVSSYNASDPYELLISQMVTIERAPQAAVETQKNQQTQYRAMLSDLDSTLSALKTALSALTDPVASAFGGRAVKVGNGATFTGSATDKASLGSHTLDVRRLASADARVSQRYQNSGTGLKSWLDGNGGTQAFSIEVAHPTADDPDNRVSIAVSVTPQGTTDGAILGEVQTAIADALAQAVKDKKILSTEKPSVSLIRETTGSARLSVSAGQTGYTNRLGFTDSAGGFLQQLQLTNQSVVAEGQAGGGMRADVGTSAETSALNSRAVLDGMLLYRDTNQVSDALTGVTLSLTAVSTNGAASFSVDPDGTAAEGQIKKFVSAYNNAVEFIRKKSAIDVDNKTRGLLADDSTVRSLRTSMRTDVAKAGGAFDGGLAALGLTMKDDGTLAYDQASKFQATLAANPEAVAEFFSGQNGLAKTLEKRLDGLVGATGVIRTRRDVADQRIKRFDTTIKAWDEKMTRRETELRQQFAKMQETMTLLQGQQNNFLAYYGG